MKKLLTIITMMIISLIGITSVKAQDIGYSFKEYRVQIYSLGTGDNAWTNYVNFNTATTISSGYGVSGIAVKFGYTNKFTAGQKYRVVIDIAWQPATAVNITAINVDHTNCLGTTTINNWNATANNIESCEYIGYSKVPNSTRVKYMYDITPGTTVEGIQFNIYYGGTAEVSYIRVNTASSITTGDNVTGAIDEQTVVIQEEFENITNVITEVNENLINSITEQNQVCQEKSFVYNSTDLETGQILSNGNVGSDSSMKHTDYIEINQTSETFNEGNWPNAQTSEYFCIYDKYKTKTRCFSYNTYYSNNKFLFNQFNENEKYIRLTLWNNVNNRGTIYVKMCKNGNQAIIDEDHNYTTDDTINDTVEQEHELQEDILDSLDNSYMNNWEMDLSGDSPNYVYNKMTLIYGINQKWIAFITTVLGLGIIKLILNR